MKKYLLGIAIFLASASPAFATTFNFNVSPSSVTLNKSAKTLTFTSDTLFAHESRSQVWDPNNSTPYFEVNPDTSCANQTTCTISFTTWQKEIQSGDQYLIYITDNIAGGGGDLYISNTLTYTDSTPTPTPTPTTTPTPAVQIVTDPATANVTVDTPFNVDVKITNTGSQTFNAAQATISKSTNLTITRIQPPSSNACGFTFVPSYPTADTPSFAGAILGGSKTSCTVYTMTLKATSSGDGSISIDTNGASIKDSSNNSELLTGVNGSTFTITDQPTPTPTTSLPQLTINYAPETYYLNDSYALSGTKDTSSITHVFVKKDSGSYTDLYPSGNTDATWNAEESLNDLGENNSPSDTSFTIYGSDGNGNQTATQTITVSRHYIGDIDGQNGVDIADASRFAADWGKSSPPFTYTLSDMDGNGAINLDDFSILARHYGE